MADTASTGIDWSERAARCLEAVLTNAPHIHVLTNPVAQRFSANLLLAVGAQPSMSAAPGEIEAFAARTSALVANLGMLDDARRDALARALPIVQRRALPWVLDPVKIDRSPERCRFAVALVAKSPTVVRGNAAEMALLADLDIAARATTGAVDVVQTGAATVRIANGHPLMDRVTAVGCAGTTLIAAFLAIEEDSLVATVAALLALGVAGELAGETAQGPGTFMPALLDALYHLSPDQLSARANVA